MLSGQVIFLVSFCLLTLNLTSCAIWTFLSVFCEILRYITWLASLINRELMCSMLDLLLEHMNEVLIFVIPCFNINRVASGSLFDAEVRNILYISMERYKFHRNSGAWHIYFTMMEYRIEILSFMLTLLRVGPLIF